MPIFGCDVIESEVVVAVVVEVVVVVAVLVVAAECSFIKNKMVLRIKINLLFCSNPGNIWLKMSLSMVSPSKTVLLSLVTMLPSLLFRRTFSPRNNNVGKKNSKIFV